MTTPTIAVQPAAPTLAPLLAWLVFRAGIEVDALSAAAEVDPESVAEGAADPARLVNALRLAEQGPAACGVLACALPPREGVWWGWLSARHATQLPGAPPLTATAAAALAAAERWIAQPDEDNRRAAWTAADLAGLDTAAGSAAAAVFFTGGSVAPAGMAFVPPPAGLHCTLAGAAVVSSAASDAEQFAALLDVYIAQGLAVVTQLGGWDASVQLASQHFEAQRELHAEAVGAAQAVPQPAAGA
jgi:hypothetical protein